MNKFKWFNANKIDATKISSDIMNSTIDIEEYYKNNYGYDLLITSLNLFDKANIDSCLKDMDYLGGLTLDEFNFLMVRLAVALELSLKGIAVNKRFNIFSDDKKILLYNKINIRHIRTYELRFFLDNLKHLLEQVYCDKYRETFYFFKDKRNETIHFSKNLYQYNSNDFNDEKGNIKKGLITHFKLLKEFFDTVIRPIKNKATEETFKKEKL